MKKMKRISLMAMAVLMGTAATAQDAERVETTLSADVVNQYIWRGQDLGNVSLQPTLGVAWQGLSLTAWGSVGLSDASDTKEFDLTLGYTTGGLNIGITDYWTNAGDDPEGRYFKYGAHGTNHVFEANIGYDFGVVSAQWYTNFAGNDGVNNDGKRAYSSYFELCAPFRLAACEWTATIGVVPYATSYYATTGIALTNVSLRAVKDIKVTDTFSVPLFAAVTSNPYAKKAYLEFGITLAP